MNLTARSKPYPTQQPGTYVCKRCGITKTKRTSTTHCKDCKRYAKDGK